MSLSEIIPPKDPRLVEKFELSEELDALAKQIISAHDESLKDVELFSVKFMFTNRKLSHDAAQCWRVADQFRFLYGLDFLILVFHEDWETKTFDEKAAILIHEIFHCRDSRKPRDIERNVFPKPAIRRHSANVDFCEKPEHDEFSRKTLARIRKKMNWKPTIET